jgi:hypothetical protein
LQSKDRLIGSASQKVSDNLDCSPCVVLDDWGLKYRPTSVADSKVHFTKVKALRQWFQSLLDATLEDEKTCILVVYGGSGSGKRTLCELIAKEMSIELIDADVSDKSTHDSNETTKSSNPRYQEFFATTTLLDEPHHKNRNHRSLTEQLFVASSSRMMMAEEMTIRSRYPSLLASSTATLASKRKKLSVSVLSEADEVISQNDLASQNMRNHLLSTLVSQRRPVLILLSGSLGREDAFSVVNNLFAGPLGILKQTCAIESLFLTAPTDNKITKVLQHIRDKEILSATNNIHLKMCNVRPSSSSSSSLLLRKYRELFSDDCIQEIVARSRGDLRQATLLLRFCYLSTAVCESNRGNAPKQETVVVISDDDSDSKPISRKKRRREDTRRKQKSALVDLTFTELEKEQNTNTEKFPQDIIALSSVSNSSRGNSEKVPEMLRDVLCSAQSLYYSLLHSKLGHFFLHDNYCYSLLLLLLLLSLSLLLLCDDYCKLLDNR